MSGRNVLSGSLEFLNLGDLLQLLGSNGSTGVLRLKSKYAQEPGEIFISKGNPINATCLDLTGLDALNSFFGWTIGEFEFQEGNIKTEAVIKKSRMNIILDSLSMLDEGAIEILGPVSYEKKTAGSDQAIVLPTVRGPIIDYMYVVDEEEFRDGQEIAVEGSHGNWIWVVLEGDVHIVKQTDQGPLELLRVSEGAFIGSTASFLMGGNVRGATALASGDVQLGVLDAQRMASEFAQFSAPFKGLISSLDRRLRNVTENIVAVRAGAAANPPIVNDIPPVIKQGDAEDKVFEITKGEAYVVRRTDGGNLLLATLGPGDTFGRIPFFDFEHEPESASVFGSEEMKVKPVEIDTLQEEYERLSLTFKNLLDHTTTCITVTTRLALDFHKKATKANRKKKNYKPSQN